MKQGHFLLLFFVIYVSCFMGLFIQQKQYDEVLKEKRRIEICLKDAAEASVLQLAAVLNETDEKKQRVAEQTFFDMLAISMGAVSEPYDVEKYRLFVPMLILLEEDGVSYYYVEQEVIDGKQQISPVWSEKKKFLFTEDDSKEQKKSCIVKEIELTASKIISEHNLIATQYGLEYQFYVPDFLGNIEDELYTPMIIAVFQGWPMASGQGEVYENCVDASVYLQRVKQYVVEFPCTLEMTKTYYHEPGCDYAGKYGGVLWDETVTKEMAILRYGALPCDVCLTPKEE